MIDFNNYEKNTVIVSSDRLVFNSKADSVYIIANKTVGLSALDQVHVNIGPVKNGDPKKNYFILNSPKIQFGMPEDGKSEPVAKAQSTVECIDSILNKLLEFCIQLKSAAGVGVGTVSLVQVNIASDKLYQDIINLKKKYASTSSPIISKITNTI